MTKFSTRCVIVFVIACILFLFQYNLFFRNITFHIPRHQPQQSEEVGNQTRLPTALIIGVRKGGTRALLDAIALHPHVRIVRRETHFFDSNYSLGVDWYRQQMPVLNDPNEIIIEKTPAYFTNDMAPKRVYEMDPNMKLILIVRHPVYRTISDFTQVYYNKLEQNKSLPILSIEAFRTTNKGNDGINMDYKPITNSLYDVHISKWLNYFPIQNFLFINGDVFRANPINELRRMEKFLNLKRAITPSQLVFDYKKGFFCFKKTIKIKCLGQSKGRKHRSVSDDVVHRLFRSFEDHNQNFFRLINRTFVWE